VKTKILSSRQVSAEHQSDEETIKKQNSISA